jgi:RNA polymerase sigma-70 factor (ECF subfamily)
LNLFERLLRENETKIYRVAYRMTGNHEDAEDLIQETVEDALRAFAYFQPGTHFDRWFLRIMTNNFIDKARRRSKVKFISTDQAADPLEDTMEIEFPDSTLDPQRVVEDEVMDEQIQGALNSLPEEFRTVVVLCDIEQFSYEEISKMLGCPIGTVRSRLHRGRNQLIKKLREHEYLGRHTK